MDKVIFVRRCEEKNLPDVIKLMEQLGEVIATGENFLPGEIKKMFLEMENFSQVYLNLIAEIDNQVVGFISLIFYKTFFHTGGTALINELIVEKNLRGVGVGRKLIEEAVKEAKKRGMDEIEVGTEKTNLDAQSFYRKAGFDEECLLFGIEF
jgi:ribosomal protein S18 acetylase RimI-like enzyme